MAARVSDACDPVGPGPGARENPQCSVRDPEEFSRAVVYALVQEISRIEKDTCAFDWNWGAAGTCEDAGCAFGVPPLGGHLSFGVPPLGGHLSFGVPPLGGHLSFGVPPLGGYLSFGVPPLGGRRFLWGSLFSGSSNIPTLAVFKNWILFPNLRSTLTPNTIHKLRRARPNPILPLMYQPVMNGI